MKENKLGKQLALWFLAVGAVVLLVFFWQRRWHGQGLRAVLLVSQSEDRVRQPMKILLIDPSERTITQIPIPQETAWPALFKHGFFVSDALPGLTALEDYEADFLSSSIGMPLGIGIEGVLWRSKPLPTTRAQVVRWLWLHAINGAPTDLPLWDRWRLLGWVLFTPASGWQDRVVPTTTEVDGTSRLSKLKDWQDPVIRRSGATIVIRNGTDEPGLAARLAEGFEQWGFRVRNVETGEVGESRIVWSGEKEGDLGWSLQQLLSVWRVLPTTVDQAALASQRADVILELGPDLVSRYRRH